MSVKDRRKAPRVDIDLPVVIEGSEGEVSGRTLNISSNGVYFEIPHYMELMTRVRMGLAIPAAGDDGKGESIVSFDGVVVRIEPENEAPQPVKYRIAVFFTAIPESSRDILATYINRTLK
ncbi:MAG: PilZ domain-containing protein [Candidatus Krumholzibacteriota bacterium]|nr:PilZ domain-containing protein [Candidatus Krumholzibacteriota bacterium]